GDVGLLRAPDTGQRPGGCLAVGLPERVGRLGVRPVGHAGAGVPEELDALDAQDLGGGVRLVDPPLPELLAGFEEAVVDLAVLPLGRQHEDDAIALFGGLLHDAARADALVVGVGVEQDHGASGAGHYATAPASRSLAISAELRPTSPRISSVCSPAFGGSPSPPA